MKIVSLASGSGGNAYLLSASGSSILIDCGLSCRELISRCKKVEIEPESIIGVLFTHNHGDHAKGAAAFHKKFKDVTLYANLMTADAISASLKMNLSDFLLFENGQNFEIGPFSIRAFSIPHDVPDPVGFVVRAEAVTYFHATDVGIPLNSIGVNLSEANVVTLESNHDLVLLSQCDKPPSQKQRVRGPRGHLSNDDAAELVKKFANKNLTHLALAHLSETSNMPHIAERTMRQTLDAISKQDISLSILSQDTPVIIYEKEQLSQ